jgi:hypothetical protein
MKNIRESSTQTDKIENAIAWVSANVGVVETNDKGAHDSPFTNYMGIMKALDPHLKKQDLSLSLYGSAEHQEMAGEILSTSEAVTKILHQPSGQWISQRFVGPHLRGNMQSLASDITMAKRYNLTLLFNLVYTEDADDKDGVVAGDPLLNFNPHDELLYVELLAELNNAKSTRELGEIYEKQLEERKRLDQTAKEKLTAVANIMMEARDKEANDTKESKPPKKAKSAKPESR